MSEVISLSYAWGSLSPAPLNHATIGSVRSLDGMHIFCHDGTNASVFSFDTLQWSTPFACPPVSFPAQYGPVFSQVVNGYYQIINTVKDSVGDLPRTYLCSLEEGYLKDLVNFANVLGNQIITSSDYNGYIGQGLTWPPGLNLQGQAAWYLSDYPGIIFYALQWATGPANIVTMMVDLLSGKPLFQFNDGSQFLYQAEMWNEGVPGTFAYGSDYPDNPFVSGGTFSFADDIAKAVETNTIDNLYAFIEYNDIKYGCTSIKLNTSDLNVHMLEGFYGSIADLVVAGGSTNTNFIVLLNQDGVPFTYTPYQFVPQIDAEGNVHENYVLGQFGLGVTIEPPETIPLTSRPYNRYSFQIANGNVFGYFLEDFSQGWYLGIGTAGYGVYSLLNYQRIDQ